MCWIGTCCYTRFINCGVNSKLYFAIKQIIHNVTKAIVRVNGELTNWFVIGNGVRQGGTLSSTLFPLYINDLVETLNGLDIGINIDVRKVCALLYIDDVVLAAESPRLLDALYNWCCKWKIGENYEKSKIFYFMKKRKFRSEYTFRLLNCHLNYINSYKYLEVYFNEHLDYEYNLHTLPLAQKER